MNDEPSHIPGTVRRLLARAAEIGFAMACDDRTGALLRTLAASKPSGRILELGTGVGVGSAWLLAGMNSGARLVTVEREPELARIAHQELGEDDRLEIVTTNADAWVAAYPGPGIDMVFVDCRPGKFHARSAVLNHLSPGGLYLADDLLPQTHLARGSSSQSRLLPHRDPRPLQPPGHPPHLVQWPGPGRPHLTRKVRSCRV